MKNLQIALIAAGLIGGGYSGVLVAARENPLELKVADLEARLIRIERVMDNQSLIQLSTEVQKLRAENQALRGELDKLRYDSTNSDSRQRELYVDLDRRLQTVEAAPRCRSSAAGGCAAQSLRQTTLRRPRKAQRHSAAACGRPAAISRTIRPRST